MKIFDIFYDKILEISNNKNIVFYIYILLFIVCFLLIAGQNIRLNSLDDIVHSEAVTKYGSAYNFMIDQYNNWNSRYATSLIMSFVMDKNIWLWRILNAFVLFALIIYLSKIIKVIYKLDDKKYALVLLFIFSSTALLSSGIWTQSVTWVTGSFNYLWPASFLIISLYYLLNYAFNKAEISLLQFIILIPVVLFATNTEQTGLIFLAMYLIYILYSLYKYKSVNIYILILFLAGLISVYFVLSSEALHKRYLSEIKSWYPAFADLSTADKIIQGVPYTILYGFLLNDYTGTIVFSVILFIIIKNKYNSRLYNILSLLPAFYSLIHYIARVNVEWRDNFFIYNLRKFSSRYLDNNLSEPFISVIIGLFILIYFTLKIEFSSIQRKYLSLLFFSAAFMSAFMLNFSPTIYASGERIWFTPYIMYLLGISILSMELLKYINISSKKFIIIFSIYFITGLIDVFSKIYR